MLCVPNFSQPVAVALAFALVVVADNPVFPDTYRGYMVPDNTWGKPRNMMASTSRVFSYLNLDAGSTNTKIFDCNNSTIQAERIVPPLNNRMCSQTFKDMASCTAQMMDARLSLDGYAADGSDNCKSTSKVAHTGTLYTKAGSDDLCVAVDGDGEAVLLSIFASGKETLAMKVWAKGADIENSGYTVCTA